MSEIQAIRYEVRRSVLEGIVNLAFAKAPRTIFGITVGSIFGRLIAGPAALSGECFIGIAADLKEQKRTQRLKKYG